MRCMKIKITGGRNHGYLSSLIIIELHNKIMIILVMQVLARKK